MNTPKQKNMKSQSFLALIFFFMAACAPAVTPSPIEPSAPSPVPPTFTATVVIPIIIDPTPTPTQPIIPVITPDAIQVARWKEYENGLAMKLLPPSPTRTLGEVLCEWEILGRSDQEVYVWAFCQAPPYVEGLPPSIASMPAVIYLGEDGAIQNVKIPGSGTAYTRDIQMLFPPGVQQIILNHSVDTNRMEAHINARRENPQPPLNVLSATPVP